MWINLQAKLNVSRALYAQRYIGRLDGRRPHRKGPYRLLARPSADSHNGEHLLIDDNNILIGSPLRYSFAMAYPASSHLMELVHQIEYALLPQLAHSAHSCGTAVWFAERYTLRGLEVYWEFDAPDPIATVDILAPRLSAVVNESWSTARAVRLYQSHVIQQSRSYSFRLRQKTSLRIYAKTNRRVRFEVCFGKEAISKACESHEDLTRDELRATVDALVDRASGCLTELFRSVAPPFRGVPETATADDLKRIIESSHADPNVTSFVLTCLQRLGRIVPKGNTQFRDAVVLLKRRGVLQMNRRHGDCYIVSPRYAGALAAYRLEKTAR